MSRWKIQKSSLASWSFGSQWLINWTFVSSCVPLWLNFSYLNPRLPSPFSFTFDLYWLNVSLNFATVDPMYCLKHTYMSLQVTIKQKINAVFFLVNRTFKLISTFKYFTYITNRTQQTQWRRYNVVATSPSNVALTSQYSCDENVGRRCKNDVVATSD